MKVTMHLMDWLRGEFGKQFKTYADAARASGTNYQNWQRLLTSQSKDVTETMQKAICKAFNISRTELSAINEGVHDLSGTGPAARLWRWVAADQNRVAALRAMGYKSELPNDVSLRLVAEEKAKYGKKEE